MAEYLDERLGLTRSSIGVWRADADYLVAAEAASAATGLVDAQNLVRAGEMLQQIEAETRVLQHLLEAAGAETAAHIEQMLKLLGEIEAQVKGTSRRLHGLT